MAENHISKTYIIQGPPMTIRILKRTGPGLVVLDIFSGEKKTLPWEFIDTLKNAGRLPKNAALVAGRILTILPEAKR